MFASVALGQQPERAPDQHEIIKRFGEAMRTGNVKVMDQLMAPDNFEISPAGEFDPRAKVLGFYQEPQFNPAQSPKAIEFDEWQIVDASKDVHIVSTREISVVGTPQGERRIPIRVTTILRRVPAGWQIVTRHYTGIRPPRKA